MILLDTISNKKIFYTQFSTDNNWIKDFPNENWAIIIISDEKNMNYFKEIINKTIDRNVGYIVSVGMQYELIHDLADEEIIFREVNIEEHHLPNHSIITIGENDFEEGIWSGIYCSLNEETKIENVIILDVEKTNHENIKNLIERFKKGYIPENK